MAAKKKQIPCRYPGCDGHILSPRQGVGYCQRCWRAHRVFEHRTPQGQEADGEDGGMCTWANRTTNRYCSRCGADVRFQARDGRSPCGEPNWGTFMAGRAAATWTSAAHPSFYGVNGSGLRTGYGYVMLPTNHSTVIFTDLFGQAPEPLYAFLAPAAGDPAMRADIRSGSVAENALPRVTGPPVDLLPGRLAVLTERGLHEIDLNLLTGNDFATRPLHAAEGEEVYVGRAAVVHHEDREQIGPGRLTADVYWVSRSGSGGSASVLMYRSADQSVSRVLSDIGPEVKTPLAVNDEVVVVCARQAWRIRAGQATPLPDLKYTATRDGSPGSWFAHGDRAYLVTEVDEATGAHKVLRYAASEATFSEVPGARHSGAGKLAVDDQMAVVADGNGLQWWDIVTGQPRSDATRLPPGPMVCQPLLAGSWIIAVSERGGGRHLHVIDRDGPGPDGNHVLATRSVPGRLLGPPVLTVGHLFLLTRGDTDGLAQLHSYALSGQT